MGAAKRTRTSIRSIGQLKREQGSDSLGAESLNHLTQINSAASATSYTAFDPVGRMTATSQQTLAGSATPYQFGTAANPGYTYNLAREMTAEAYSSGRRVSYTYDAAGRTKYVTNPAGNDGGRIGGGAAGISVGAGERGTGCVGSEALLQTRQPATP